LKDKGKRVYAVATSDLVHDQRMQRICLSLSETGYIVTLTGRKLPESLPAPHTKYSSKRIKCLFLKGPLFYAEFNIRVLCLLLFRNVDIIIAADTDTMPAAAIASIIKGIPLVFDAHEYFSEVPELKERQLVKKIWHVITLLTIRRATLNITVSQPLANELSRRYNKSFKVIMNSPPLQKNRGQSLSQGEKVNNILLYQGVLNTGRGLPEIVAAMQYLDAILIIAGDGVMRAELERLAAEKGVSQKVEFRGMLNAEELMRETEKATVGLNILSDESLSYQLSLSNKFFNYIHAGIPQLTPDFPGYREINNQWEIALMCKCATEDIAANMNLLLNNQQLRERLRNNCRMAAAKLNWQIEEEKLLQLFKHL
jgi:glycosyltransferase involved in cell wall biosynthesis